MAVNFNLLAREGPTNLYEGFERGQQAAAQNALAQQKMAQERDLMSMRRQEFQANIESTQAERKRKTIADKTAMFRERLLRASTPQAARELVRLQHSDPDLGPVMQQFGSLEQDLTDVPDDPAGFENWRQREAVGAAELIKSQASERSFQELLARVRGGQQGAAAPVAAPASQGELVAAPIRPIPSPVAAPAAADAPAPAGETNLQYLQRQFGTTGGAAGPNALAPAAAPTTNVLAAPTGGGRTPAQIRAEMDALSMSNDPRAVRMVQTLAKEYEAALRADPSETRTMQQLGYPLTQEGYRQFRQAQMNAQTRAPIAVLQNGRPVYVSPEQAVGQTPFTPASVQVLGMGPGREPPAPTITQIQDPTDPTRMITIDARRYQGGGVGTPGVIGASGKTPAATAAAMKKEEGATQAKDILDTLRTAYDTLDQARAVPSQQRNALSNALSYVAGTGVGQVAGRVVGTEAQTQRDIIASARNQMLNAIKNATGMSAQQLNSNVEFRSWLEALTDPTRSIEANRAILDNMEKFIASGGKYSAKGGGQAAPAAAPAGGVTGGNLSPAEQAELDQLRARFGKNKP